MEVDFLGWATSPSGGVVYDPGDRISGLLSDLDLYAVWEETIGSYTVRYGNFYGTHSTDVVLKIIRASTGAVLDSVTLSEGETGTVAPNSVSSGDSFHAWFGYFSNSSYDYNTYRSGNTSITWIGNSWDGTYDIDEGSFDVREVYTISYNGNGATTGSTTATEKVHGISTTLASNGFSRPGYTFLGWGTSAGGSAIYDPGDTYTGNASRTLYAIWEQDYYYAYLYVNFVNNYGTYDVSLDVSGSGLTTKSISEGETVSFSYQTYGSASSITVTVRETSPSPNYFYVGTSSSPSSLTSYSFTWDRNSDKTVNIYTEQRYAITYDGNGATSGSTSTTYYCYNDSSWPRVANNGFSRTGYTFAGWATSPTGSVQYNEGDSYTSNGYPTLYAVWDRITYTISYNGNGNTGGTMSPTTKYYGTSVTLRANAFTRTGYHFVGWALSSTGSVVYDDQDTYSTNASDTLYAKWTANTYYVSFQPNGASGSAYTQTFTWGVSTQLTANRFTRSGYDFLGWSVGSASAGVSYGDMATVSNLTTSNGGTVYFYAQWEAKVQAKYDSVGGYWYVENGKMPQTRVTSSSLITNINNSTTWGQTYCFAGKEERAKTYGGVEYWKWNGNWYEVEPIKWRLTSDPNQTTGYVSTSPINAVLAKIVYVDQYSSTYLGSGAGYSAEAVTEFLKNGISTKYLDGTYARTVEYFGDGTTFITTSTTTAQVLVASESEINAVAGTTAIEFSDLVKDVIKSYGGTNVYFTRDLGSNYNNITCFNGAGKDTQRLANEYRGVQFTLRFTEYTCVA